MQLPSLILKKLIRLYQITLSPLLGISKCRFHPTCSNYAKQAIDIHGSVKGSWLTAKRVIRCHPLCTGGVDPVPMKKYKKNKD